MRSVQWMKRLGPVLLLFLMLPVVLVGCGQDKPEPTETTVITEPPMWTAPEETQGISVDNVYMTFYYPKEWEGEVAEVREEQGSNIVVTFRTVISEQEVVLFSVILGPEETDGDLLGQLHDSEAGVINVYSMVNEQNPADWSAQDYERICRLQERVNDIIVQFYEDERFVPTRG